MRRVDYEAYIRAVNTAKDRLIALDINTKREEAAMKFLERAIATVNSCVV